MKDLEITQEATFEKSVDFFSDKVVLVQPKRIQDKVYSAMRTVQNYVPMTYTSEVVAGLRTTSQTGLSVITNAPLTFIGATYFGSRIFRYCYFGCIVGQNSVKTVLNTTSFVLSRPI